jgi:hypothetical protein
MTSVWTLVILLSVPVNGSDEWEGIVNHFDVGWYIPRGIVFVDLVGATSDRCSVGLCSTDERKDFPRILGLRPGSIYA